MPPAHRSIFCYVTDRRAMQAAPDSPFSSPADSAPVPAQLLHDAIRRAVANGASWIQIREKDLEARQLVELARFAVEETRAAGARVLINDRLDVAVASKAGGVHLGGNSLPLETVVQWRHSTGRTDFLIGVSCHSLESARSAERGGADYVFFGPVFATPSKAAFGAPQGLDRLRDICAAIEIPVLAIGGVNFQNAEDCLTVGAAGIAGIRMFQ